MGLTKQKPTVKSGKQEALAALQDAQSFIARMINTKMYDEMRQQFTGAPDTKLKCDHKLLTFQKSNDPLVRDIKVIFNLLKIIEQVIAELDEAKKITVEKIILKAIPKAPSIIKLMHQAGDNALEEIGALALGVFNQAKVLNEERKTLTTPLQNQFRNQNAPKTGNEFSDEVIQHAQKTYDQLNGAYQKGGIKSIRSIYAGIKTLLSLKTLIENTPTTLTDEALKSLNGVVPLIHNTFVLLDEIEEEIGLFQGAITEDITKIAKSLALLLKTDLLNAQDDLHNPCSDYREQARLKRKAKFDEKIAELNSMKEALLAEMEVNNLATGMKKAQAKASNFLLKIRIKNVDKKLAPLLFKQENIAKRAYESLVKIESVVSQAFYDVNFQNERDIAEDPPSLLSQFYDQINQLIFALERLIVDLKYFLIEVVLPKGGRQLDLLKSSITKTAGYDSHTVILSNLGHEAKKTPTLATQVIDLEKQAKQKVELKSAGQNPQDSIESDNIEQLGQAVICKV